MQIEQSLPVAFGAETAKWICVGAIDITQISVVGMLLFTLSVALFCLYCWCSSKLQKNIFLIINETGLASNLRDDLY